MGLFDRFKPAHEQKKEKKVRHAVDATAAKDAAFAAVGSAGKTADKVEKSEKVDKAATETKKRVQRDDTRQAFRVLVRPMVTEKSTQLRTQNRYAFAVNRRATKLGVKMPSALYGVRPNDITIKILTESLFATAVQLAAPKPGSAIVTLPAGKTIDVVSLIPACPYSQTNQSGRRRASTLSFAELTKKLGSRCWNRSTVKVAETIRKNQRASSGWWPQAPLPIGFRQDRYDVQLKCSPLV